MDSRVRVRIRRLRRRPDSSLGLLFPLLQPPRGEASSLPTLPLLPLP